MEFEFIQSMTIVEILLITLSLIQTIYWVLLYIGISKDKSQAQVINIPVSIIVCAHDEEENLKQLVPILLNQNHPTYEVIIVNDCSNDGTFDFLREEALKDSRLKPVNVNHIPEHVNGKKYGLTLGIKAAKYDWVLLTDADCRPGTEWVKEMSASFTDDKSFVLAYSPYAKQRGLLNSFIRFETILTALQFLGFAKLRWPYMATGRNLAYRKKVFLDNKGFNAHLDVIGGDDDLFVNQHSNSNNTAVVLSAKSLVTSKPKETWRDYYLQKIRHLSVGKRYTGKSRFWLAPFMMSWIILWVVMLYCAFFLSWEWIGGILFFRWLTMFVTINAFSKKSGEDFDDWKIPFLDFIFCFYYLVAGFGALFTKRIKWKKI